LDQMNYNLMNLLINLYVFLFLIDFYLLWITGSSERDTALQPEVPQRRFSKKEFAYEVNGSCEIA
jgi:hypothetical protein